MSETSQSLPSPLGRALGRVPSGIFILTVRQGEKCTGMLASWVQQAGFEPPMLTVAVRSDRFVGNWIVESGRFTLNQVAAGQKGLIRHFARGFEPGDNAFEGLALHEATEARGGPVLADALGFLDAELEDRLEGKDHRVYLARVVAGAILHEELEPMLHVRHNGFHY